MQEIEWTNDLVIDELPLQHRTLAECIGIDAMLKMVKQYGGLFQYIPKEDALLRTMRDKRIKREYNGHNISALARKYNISEIHVRRLLDEGDILPGQVGLFDQIENS